MADSPLRLPERIRQEISTFPEFSYGAKRVTLVFADGVELRDVYVAWDSEVVRVGTKTNVSFDISKIVGVKNQP